MEEKPRTERDPILMSLSRKLDLVPAFRPQTSGMALAIQLFRRVLPVPFVPRAILPTNSGRATVSAGCRVGSEVNRGLLVAVGGSAVLC